MSVLCIYVSSQYTTCPFITLCLGSKGTDLITGELCYKGTILQRNYRKNDICRHFPLIPSKKIASHNMNVLYPNLYNEECYKGIAL